MRMNTKNVSTLDPLVASFVNGTSSLNCLLNDLKRHSQNHQPDTDLVVLKLLEEWVAPGRSTTWGCKKGVDVNQLLEIIQVLKAEHLFSQLILLIPEKSKRKVITDLRSATVITEHSPVKEYLFTGVCGSYTMNFMSRMDRLDNTVVKAFFDNVSDILEWCGELIQKNVLLVFDFIDNILGDSSGDKYDYEPFSILNKSGKEHVRNLQHIIKQSKSDDQMSTKFTTYFTRVLAVDGYSIFLDNALNMLIPLIKEYHPESTSLERDAVHRIITKLNGLKCCLGEGDITCANKPTLIMKLDELFDLLRGILKSSDPEYSISLEIEEIALGGRTNLSYYKWKNETDPEAKLLLALECLNNLYYGYQEIHACLLNYDDLPEKHAQAFVNHLSGYTVNYGSASTLTKYIEKIFLLQSQDSSSYLLSSLQPVVLNCLPYISIASCNTVLRNSMDCFTNNRHILFTPSYTDTNFHASLNELFNKLTSQSSCDDVQLLNRLSRLCVISPLVLMEELIGRIFSDLLNHSICRTVMKNVPTLYDFNSDVTDFGDHIPTVLVYTKNSFVLNKERQTAGKNLTAILTILLDCVPEELMNRFCHCLVDSFINPNLAKNRNACAFFDLDLTLKVVDVMAQFPCCAVMSLDCSISIIRSLISAFLEESVEQLHHQDKINNLLADLVVAFTCKLNNSLEEKMGTLDTVGQFTRTNNWTIAFYFFSLFKSTNYSYQFKIPPSLTEFCSLPDTFAPCEGGAVGGVNDQPAWKCVFEVAYISTDAGHFLTQYIQPFNVDDEMSAMVESAGTVLKRCPSVGRAKSIIAVLSDLINQGKINHVTEYFSDGLRHEVHHHGTCFSMLVIIQSFLMSFDDVEENETSQMQNGIQSYTKIFHLFLQYSKEVADMQVRSYVLLYLFEQLVFTAGVMGEGVSKILMLLLMDILVATMDCINSSSGDVASVIKERCESILSNAECDVSLLCDRLLS